MEDLAKFVKENGKNKVDAYAPKDEKKSKGDASASSESPAATGDDHDEL